MISGQSNFVNKINMLISSLAGCQQVCARPRSRRTPGDVAALSGSEAHSDSRFLRKIKSRKRHPRTMSPLWPNVWIRKVL